MDSTKFNMYKTAADVANLAMEKAIELCHNKMKASYICTFCDTLINEKLAQSYKKLQKGVMLPTCLSINSIVSHNSYTEKDDYQLVDGDIVRIELACHIDNNVASAGETIKIGDNNWSSNEMFVAATKAMQVGIQMIKPGTEVINFKNYIEKVVNKFGYHLVQRPNVFHDPDTIIYYDWSHRDNGFFCEPSWLVKNDKDLFLFDEDELSDDEFDKEQEFTTGEVYHLTVAISNSPKITFESNKRPVIFQRTQNTYHLKSKHSRELLNNINKNFGTSCWKISNVDLEESKVRIGLRECLQHGVIRSLGIVEQNKSDIIILKCSIAINDNSVYKLTGDKYNKIITHPILDEECNNILSQPKQFNKRSDYLDL